MTDTLALIGGFSALAIVLCAAAVLLLRRRKIGSRPDSAEELCPECGKPLPRGAAECPACAQTPSPASRAGTESPAPALVGLAGPVSGEVFPINPAPRGLTIGRHPDNDIVLSNLLAISRYHAQVMPEGAGWVLYDRNSANGTLVNDRRVFRHQLADGDVIQLLGVRLAFSLSGAMLAPASEPPSPPSLADTPSFTPQDRLDGCVLEELLGRGGMSVVYRGHDEQGKTVAIKVLNVTDEYIVRKFIQEEQIGEMLGQHPYIREVTRLGRGPRGNLFLVMEYVDGCSLRRLIGQLSEDEIVRIIGQCCVALAYAHERRVVHRDIKPENILIAQDGGVKLTDFGIAKLTSSVTVTTDRVVGTPEYLSPEQARGDQHIRPSSDVYSMGVVLYELLAGQVPFPLPRNGDSYRAAITVLGHHINTPPPPVRERNPDAAAQLEAVALRALNKNPAKRFGTALAMGEALGYVEQPAPLPAEPESRPPLGLIIVEGARRGQQILVLPEGVTIGRADLDPEDTSISRRHAVVSLRGDQLWLEDISLNGTRVNGERVYGESPIHIGDRVAIGGCLLTLSAQSTQST